MAPGEYLQSLWPPDIVRRTARPHIFDLPNRVNLIQARTHWIVAVTPECQSYAYRLNALHLERCGDGMSFMHIPELRIHPLLCTLPKGQVSYDDLVGVIGHIPGVSREVVEAKAWILLTSGDVEAGMAAVDRYIAVDPLCN
jgi:hypothetical protein